MWQALYNSLANLTSLGIVLFIQGVLLSVQTKKNVYAIKATIE